MVAHQSLKTIYFRGESYFFLVDCRAGFQDVAIIYLNLDLVRTENLYSSRLDPCA